MSEAATLARRMLPSGATPFERAHLAAQIAAWPLDVAAIARQSDPYTCDAAWLPFLFFDRGGTLWSDAWPEVKRRQVVADLLTYKRLEGTPAGLEAYINLADGVVLDEVLPPANAFLLDDTGLDAAAILALMPQLRLYGEWPDHENLDAAFLGRDCVGGDTFLVPDQVGPLGRYPVIWDQGVVTPLAAADVSSDGRHVTFAYPGEAGWAFYAGAGFLGADCFGDTATSAPLVLDLFTAGIERVRDPILAHAEQAFVGETFLARDVGAEGFYDRLYLSDPARIATVRSGPRAAAFLGEAWMGPAALPRHPHRRLARRPGRDPAALGLPRRRLPD